LPDDKRVVLSTHIYLDGDQSGTYAQSYDDEGAAPDTGVKLLQQFITNASPARRLYVGEIGAPSDDPRWLECLELTLALAKARNIPVTAWHGGRGCPTDDPLNLSAPIGAAALAVLERLATS
jgi:endoglucanase